MPKQRLPWFKVWVGATRHEKVVTLDDRTFRAWVELLDAGSEQPTRGHFASHAAAAAIIRRPVALVRRLTEAHLLDERDDGVWLHDWPDWQRWRPEDSHTNGNGLTPESHAIDSGITRDSYANHSPPRVERAKTEKEKRDVEEDEERDVDVEPRAPTERPPTQTAKPPKVRKPISNETIEALVYEYAPQFGDEQIVRDWITRALNHTARLKALDEALYVERTWLQPELKKHRARFSPVSAQAAECSCAEARANLAINRNSNPLCEAHGDVRALSAKP